MISEKDILLNIHSIVNNFLINIYDTKNNIKILKQDIKCLNNNYFVEENNKNNTELLNIFDDTIVDDLLYKLTNYKNIVEDKINKICTHDWIHDDIDIGPESSQRITYCIKCEVTKK